MNTLHDLTDAFDELERRADEHAAAAHPAADRPARPTRRRATLTRLAPVASALVVLAVAIATLAWVHRDRNQAGSAAPTPTLTTPGQPSPTATAPTATTPSAAPTTPPGWAPPASSQAVAATARTILGGTATITVIDDGSRSGPQSSGPLPTVPTTAGPTSGSATGSAALPTTPGATGQPLPEENGAAIRGLLTADGRTGGYDLNVYFADPTDPPLCADADLAPCTVTRPASGGYLLTQTVHDRSVPGGVTVTVERLRRDGADILMHLSTQKDPKGSSTVTSPTLPLTVQQLIEFVSSDRW